MYLDKPQTTRNKIQCVLTTDAAQIVFLDTPGIHKPLHRLGEYMVKLALQSLNEVDAVLWLVEMGNWTKADDHILRELESVTQPIVLVANKADLVSLRDRQSLCSMLQKSASLPEWRPFLLLAGENLDTLVELLIGFLPEGPKYYPDDWITDHPERFVFAEFIREEILKLTEQEIPHSVAVYVEEVKEDP